jgi:hypothetical protein
MSALQVGSSTCALRSWSGLDAASWSTRNAGSQLWDSNVRVSVRAELENFALLHGDGPIKSEAYGVEAYPG